MNFRWTDTLVEPVASVGRNSPWIRVEQGRDGNWLMLSEVGRAEACWHRIAVDGSAKLLDPLEDPDLPGIGDAVRGWLRLGHGVQLLAWRVNRRAVFRVVTVAGSRICKFFRKDRRLRERWTVLPPSPSGLWRVPRMLAWEPRRRLMTLEDCSGLSLNQKWRGQGGEPADGERIAEILEWLQCTPAPNVFPVFGPSDEIELLEKRLSSFERTLKSPPARVRRVARQVIDALSAEPNGRGVLCHRDFHDKQVLLDDGEGGSLIDMDLAATGPPALDVGNILAHLRLRSLKWPGLPWREIASGIVQRSVPARGIENSLGRWTASALMRLTLIYSRRHRPQNLLDRLLVSTEAALSRNGEWDSVL